MTNPMAHYHSVNHVRLRHVQLLGHAAVRAAGLNMGRLAVNRQFNKDTVRVHRWQPLSPCIALCKPRRGDTMYSTSPMPSCVFLPELAGNQGHHGAMGHIPNFHVISKWGLMTFTRRATNLFWSHGFDEPHPKVYGRAVCASEFDCPSPHCRYMRHHETEIRKNQQESPALSGALRPKLK